MGVFYSFAFISMELSTETRLKELSISEQLIITRLINHLASQPFEYRNFTFQRLKEISQENPWLDDINGFNRKTFLKNQIDNDIREYERKREDIQT